MNELTTEIIAALAQKQDLDEVFRHHLEIAINQLLQTELAEFLGYERYSYAGINTGNNRNGSYERSFDTKYGQLNLTIPRDRNGRFENHTLPAYGRHSDNLETTVIQLYTKGYWDGFISKNRGLEFLVLESISIPKVLGPF